MAYWLAASWRLASFPGSERAVAGWRERGWGDKRKGKERKTTKRSEHQGTKGDKKMQGIEGKWQSDKKQKDKRAQKTINCVQRWLAQTDACPYDLERCALDRTDWEAGAESKEEARRLRRSVSPTRCADLTTAQLGGCDGRGKRRNASTQVRQVQQNRVYVGCA
jgi:hypothetical protein